MSPVAKIGLFMLIGLVILGVFIVKIEDIPVGQRGERLEVYALFPSVAGLDRKAAVRIAGVRVGAVEEVTLEGTQAMARLSLDPDVVLHQGAMARISSMGMLGEKYVEIVPGHPGAPTLPPDSVLPGVTPPDFDDAIESATRVGENLQDVTFALREAIGGEAGAQRMDEIVANIQELTRTLRVLIAENQANVNATTENFRAFSATLRDELPRIAEKMNTLADQLQGVVGENRQDLAASMDNIRDVSGRLRTTADNLNEITGRMARGEGSIGKLLTEEETVDNLNQTLDAIEGGVASLQNTIGRFERYTLNMEMRTETLPGTEDGEGRSAFGFDLWTNPQRFYRVQVVDSPYGTTSEETRRTTVTYPDGTSETVVTNEITTEDELTFNAQVGYQLLPGTTVRAGLFESSGGVGVDQLFNVGAPQPLRVTLEAYEFNRELDRDLHLRLEGRYHLNRNLFVMAGWDDPLESDRSSVLLGGGVSWTDEDVKYLLSLAGSAF